MDEECFECVLSDCYPSDPRCLVKRREAVLMGISLPEVADDVPSHTRAANGPYIRHEGIAPEQYKDRDDYLKQYHRTYNFRFKRITVRGIKLKRCDLEILTQVYAIEGRSLAAEIVSLLELVAEQTRAAKK
jgi:hypothetical protein